MSFLRAILGALCTVNLPQKVATVTMNMLAVGAYAVVAQLVTV
jgi:hypothetical protein